MGNPLFATKPVKLLLEEMEGENRLRSVLEPLSAPEFSFSPALPLTIKQDRH
jgi:hypothetical protein